MNLIEMFALAVGLSMDAVAVAICTGLTMRRATAKGDCCGAVLWLFSSHYAAYRLLNSHRFCGAGCRLRPLDSFWATRLPRSKNDFREL